ncbi:MAG: flagellar hook-basal body complex protein FliE [Salinisphaera sp.]|jgi:flagellar hook-basal body complex protein FliE|nr:flagellar hook-basal body complex protein FliE [Salinisphaera sp.]
MPVSGVGLQGAINQLQSAANQAAGQQNGKKDATPEGSFASALVHTIDRIDALKHSAIESGHAFEKGTPGVALNDVMVNMSKASVATEMGIQVRNRVVNAYKDIMNMQV